MPQFDIVFEKLKLALEDADEASLIVEAVTSTAELDEIDELRRLSAEIQEPDPVSFTTT